MHNTEVVISVSEHNLDFYFNKDEIYYLIYFQYVHQGEALKVVESILKQL
jgi:hypothetical protein